MFKTRDSCIEFQNADGRDISRNNPEALLGSHYNKVNLKRKLNYFF